MLGLQSELHIGQAEMQFVSFLHNPFSLALCLLCLCWFGCRWISTSICERVVSCLLAGVYDSGLAYYYCQFRCGASYFGLSA